MKFIKEFLNNRQVLFSNIKECFNRKATKIKSEEFLKLFRKKIGENFDRYDFKNLDKVGKDIERILNALFVYSGH